MRVTYSYQDKESIKGFETTEIVIGRTEEGKPVDLELAPDRSVSRRHARIWIEEGKVWIEDLNSLKGTQVDNEEIKDKGPRRLQPNNLIRIGETTLQVDISSQPDAKGEPFQLSAEQALENITLVVDATIPAFDSAAADLTVAERRLALFYDLTLQFSIEHRLDTLLQVIVERIIDIIESARRGTLMVKDQPTGRLILKAHLPPGNPVISMNLAEQAMKQREAFIWSAPDQGEATPLLDLTPSIILKQIKSAMYAPLLWKNEVLGVVCVDNGEINAPFSHDDLQLLQAVAHQAAIAVSNLQLQESLQRETKVLTNYLKLVGPQLAERMKKHRGRIRPGGEFHDATILFSDIRGFTNLSATMSPEDVTDMLEEYFNQLVPIIFKYHGTIDKFVGDAILAIFGSPDEDKDQHIHAIRAAIEMQAAMFEINQRRAAAGKHTGELGIGIHCGEVIHGFIGAAERMEFTVIGDAVNRASRYCDGAPGREILISPEIYQMVWNLIEVERTEISTKHEGAFTAYRVKRIT
jgi:adenylate cyclase